MSSTFNHIFIPIVILLIFSNMLGIDPKKVAMLSLFGILPDIDIFFLHRILLHNIFILIIPIFAYIFIKDIKISGIICFYLISHIILDVFNGGTYLLFPFYDKVFFAHTELLFRHNSTTPIMDYGISDKIVTTKGEGIVSSENIGTLAILVIAILVSITRKLNNYKEK